MPPPQHLLASRIRGFVCKSCLQKLQAPQRQRLLWASRNISTSVARLKGANKDIDVKIWDEARDGSRTELNDAVEDMQEIGKEYGISVEQTIRELERESGKTMDDLVDEDEGDLQDAMNNRMQKLWKEKDISADLPSDPELDMLAESTARVQHQLELIRKFSGGNIHTMSEENKVRLREALLAPVKKNMDKSRKDALKTNTSPDRFNDYFLSSMPQDSSPVHDRNSSIFVPVDEFPESHQPRMTQLNNALAGRQVAKRKGRRPVPKPNRAHEVWRAYMLCRVALMDHVDLVPRRTWGALWNILAEESPKNLDRMAHIKYLGDDMRNAGISLNPARHLLYIEAIYIDYDRALAIKEWEKSEVELTGKASIARNYYELGIRMFSLGCQPDQALRAAERLFSIAPSKDNYRLLLPIIRAYLASQSEYSLQRAWALYIRMKYMLGSEMTMEDYDDITSSFLTANQPYLALGAFKDMMITGDASLVEHDSTALYEKATGFVGSESLKVGEKELHWSNSKTLASLPARFNNKFFFGSWVKKLIGEGELELAKKVFDLMEDRGMRPSPIHYNGLIGAWLREGSEKYRQMAEDMCWKMIKARTEFVRERSSDQYQGLRAPLRAVESTDLPDSKTVSLIPLATIETFTILVQHYRQRLRQDLITDVYNALGRAKVTPDTGFMNELLLLDGQAHRPEWAWDTFDSLISNKQVRPDFESYIRLWTILARVVGPGVKVQQEMIGHFPNCRTLFANMIEYLPTAGVNASLKMPQELYDLIVMSFSLAQDQVGLATALEALRRRFNIFPNQETARIIVTELARLSLTEGEVSHVVKVQQKQTVTPDRINNVAKILEQFRRRRLEALKDKGIMFEQLNGIAKQEEALLLLADMLRFVVHSRISAGEVRDNYNIVADAQNAAEMMKVPECVPWESHGRV